METEQPVLDFELNIANMHCSSCERRIHEALEGIEGVLKVNANYRSGTIQFTLNTGVIREKDIRNKLESLGYRVGTNKLRRLAGFAIILVALYFLFTKSGLSNILPEITDSMSYGLLFLVGFLTSTHCVAMCGGISLYQSIDRSRGAIAAPSRTVKPALLYNAGRVTSYTLIGGSVGLLGSVISISVRMQAVIVIIAGAVMFLLGLRMLDVFPWLKKRSFRFARHFSLNRSGKSPFLIGLLNGFMPCGPLQSMQVYALGTGSFFGGAVSMFFFSSGTVPLMFGIGAVGSLLARKFAHRIVSFSALLILLLSVVMIGRGMNLAGIGFQGVSKAKSNVALAKNGIQFVTSGIGADSYEPIIVQKGAPVKWTIAASASDLNGCNSTLIIPDLNIRKKLQPGTNTLEFVPQTTGKIMFTCWMGMISSIIMVVDDISVFTDNDVESIETGYLALKEGFSIEPSKISLAKLSEGKQFISLDVLNDEISPPILVVQKGVETEWVLNGSEISRTNNFIYFPEYEIGFVLVGSNRQPKVVDLQPGRNELTIIPRQDFMFKCRNGEIGFMKVVENLEEIDMENLVRDIQTFVPSLGCCIVQYE